MDWENIPHFVKREFFETFSILRYIFILPFIFILLFLINTQIFRGNYYYNIAEQNRLRMFLINAPRGNIYDTNGELLADNRPSINVFYYPTKTTSKDEIEILLSALPEFKKNIFYSLKNNKITLIAQDIDRLSMFKILSFKHRISNVFISTEYKRRYLYPNEFCHIIGYIGEITQKEYIANKSKGYNYNDFIGKMGVEKYYEEYLKGTNGALIMEVDAKGNPSRIVKNLAPSSGNNVFLTIDKDLQIVAHEGLKKTNKNGAIVGIDPRDGSVKILVSYRDADVNNFINSVEYRKNILNDKNLPMFNRAIQGQYPCGSTFKILTAIAGLAENKTNPQVKYFCSGSFKFGDKVFKCWEKKGHGIVDLFDGIRISCNVYFINLGLKIGIDDIEKYAKKFYFGEKTGIDLPFENVGILPSKKWKKEKLKTDWYEGDTISVSIGQGYVTVTPLQLALFTSAVANRGKIYRPYIVSHITDEYGNNIYKYTPLLKAEITLPQHVWDFIHNSMKAVVKNGTGHSAFINEFPIAGKTGTAQNPHGEDHAWFICFGPAADGETPELALAIVVEHGGKGGAVAAPIAKDIFIKYAQKKKTNFNLSPLTEQQIPGVLEYGD